MGTNEGLAWQFCPQFQARVFAGSQYAVLAYQVYGLKDETCKSDKGEIPSCRRLGAGSVEVGSASAKDSAARTTTTMTSWKGGPMVEVSLRYLGGEMA